MSKELTAEDFSAAGMKILKDVPEDPASRAGLLKAADDLHAWLQNFIEKLKPLLLRLAEYIQPKEGGEQSTFDPARIADLFKAFTAKICAFVLHVERLTPSVGYEPLFIGLGDHPIVARGLARMIISLGPEYADQNNRQRRAIVKSVRVLGKKSARRVPFIAKTSGAMLSMPAARSVLDAIFAESGHQDLSYEFANLVEPAAAANPVACRRLADIAKAVAGDISPPRGRRISVATAMHELVLERLRCSGKPQAYTWSDEQQDCVDDVTQATRREVGDPDFDPWPSRRRMRARLQKKKRSENPVGILSAPRRRRNRREHENP